MEVGGELAAAAKVLARAGIDGAQLDAEVLLAHVLGVERTFLLTHPDQALTPRQATGYGELIHRRASREPLAYLTGKRWFFGLELVVSPAVLIPRPESELLVEQGLAWLQLRPAGATVVDVGTGSGAIAVSLAAHTAPQVRVFAIDSSPVALAVAQENARRHCPDRLTFLCGDLLAPLTDAADLILANLPYVAEGERSDLMPEVRDYEPDEAIFGGYDGLALIERLLAQAPGHLRLGAAIMLEIGASQGKAALQLARRHFPSATITLHPDLAGLDRILVIANPEF